MSEPSAQASVTIAASCADVYALITDLPTMATLTEETNAMEWTKGGTAQPGAVFKGRNANGGKSWTTKCTVTHAEPGRVFAFDVKSAAVVPIAHWRYQIEPAAGGCTVTEQTWDRRPGWFLAPARMATGVSDRTAENTKNIERTLQRLKAKAESSQP